MTDFSKVGLVAAELMGELPQDGGEIIAVGLVVVYEDADEEVYTRIKSDPKHRFEIIGLFEEGIHVAKYRVDVDEE